MTEQNRVTPRSEIVATPLRGMFMGNRGCLHKGHDIVRNHTSQKFWIMCRLDFKDRQVAQWVPGRYTPLFFYDEAVGLAAGHRPCAECRRADYNRFVTAFLEATGEERTRKMASRVDARLGADRRNDDGTQRTHQAAWSSLPDGTFVTVDDTDFLVRGDQIVPWSQTDGYGTPQPRPTTGDATVLTPEITVDILRAGYEPGIVGF